MARQELIPKIGRKNKEATLGAVLLILSIALSILSLTVGILRRNTCPCQPVLPTFLIVHGLAMTIRCLLDTCKICGLTKKQLNDDGCSLIYTLSKICSMLIAFWTITGSVWIYSITGTVESENQTSMYFCDSLLYWYSLVLVSVVLTGLIMKGIFILVISMVYCKYENRTWYSQVVNENLGEFV